MASLTLSSPSIQALWRLRAMALFLIGPAAGIVLVQCIFGLPKILWWSAGGMSLFMFTIFFTLFLKERTLIVNQTKDKQTKAN
ncbi:hypothetical protein MSP8886_02718 [Marinomonas spartinae]|uniref:Uncharacterized protein n=1 Tax=Marinomonas spartinae TaxID=1792290 RepID=A0A1A8TIV2_9GAMM|nr:hypothetical protein [Marinomonas spartinae]SBS33325.1 hypothetical protein MSP8886_02718 [Marinomonas spartinae]